MPGTLVLARPTPLSPNSTLQETIMASTADRRIAPLHDIRTAVVGPGLLAGGGALSGAGLVLLGAEADLLWGVPALLSGLVLLLVGSRFWRPHSPGSAPPAGRGPTTTPSAPLADLSRDVRQLVMQMQMQADQVR